MRRTSTRSNSARPLPGDSCWTVVGFECCGDGGTELNAPEGGRTSKALLSVRFTGGFFFSTKSGRYSAHIPASNETDRVATYVQHKTTFKMRHPSRATHQARADRSPEKPHCGKDLVHVSSFVQCSSDAKRTSLVPTATHRSIQIARRSCCAWNTQAQRLLHISMPDKRPQWLMKLRAFANLGGSGT